MKIGWDSNGAIRREHGMLSFVTCKAESCQKQRPGDAVQRGWEPLGKSGKRQNLVALRGTSRRTAMRKRKEYTTRGNLGTCASQDLSA
jgi:hypothetical protein